MQGPFQALPLRLRKTLPLLLLLLPAFAGCGPWRPATAPMRTLRFPGEGSPRTLVVLLPGRYDNPENYGRHEFPEIAARAGAHVDVVAVDAHLGYYYRRTIVDRLREDVLAPARKRYDRIWLVGISLGGTGSILYADQHPEDVDGIVLLAPFLGEDPVIDEVESAGGPARWRAPQPLAPDDFQRRMWVWLQGHAKGPAPIYIGWGRDDRFARANGLLARELPPGHALAPVPGGHDWRAWTALWREFVATGALGRP